MTGKIMKGIAGFYYVDVEESGIYECKAKGIFRKEGQKPLVGDLVEIEILDEAEKTGNMTRILPRKNELIRPAVANIDQALVIFALENPAARCYYSRQRKNTLCRPFGRRGGGGCHALSDPGHLLQRDDLYRHAREQNIHAESNADAGDELCDLLPVGRPLCRAGATAAGADGGLWDGPVGRRA